VVQNTGYIIKYKKILYI